MLLTIGQTIRKLRQAHGMTQWQLSQAVGCTPGKIYLIERGDESDSEILTAITTYFESEDQRRC